MGRPVWRDALEQTQLESGERAAHLALGGTEHQRSHRLWERIAAKEAARRLWKDEGRPAAYPADLAVVNDERGGPRMTRFDHSGADPMPAIAIAHAEGVAVAIATQDPSARPGIDVMAIADRSAEFESATFTPSERSLLDRWPEPSRAEWIARFHCARIAAIRANGMGSASDPAHAEILGADERTGVVLVRTHPSDPGRLVRVVTARRAEYVWAWALERGNQK
jgi:phosphopantetheinyl transferase (holo-ACP synthase)